MLAKLYLRYTDLVYGTCLKYLKDAEASKDAVMNIYQELLKKLPNHEVENFKGWLYVLTKNHCLMQLRNKHTRYQEEISDKIVPGEIPEDAPTPAEKDQQLENMEHALEMLNQEQQTCIRLFYLAKQSYQQIAGQTGFTLLQVKSYIQNGKRNLKLLLEKQTINKR